MDERERTVREALERWAREVRSGPSKGSNPGERDALYRLWRSANDLPLQYEDEAAIGRGVYPSYTSVLAACLWLEDQSRLLFETICVRFDACSKVEVLARDEISATLGIADLLLAYFRHVPAATVATLIVKSGVRNFCGCADRLPNYRPDLFDALTEKYKRDALSLQPSARYEAYRWLAEHYVKAEKVDLARRRLKHAEEFIRLLVPDPLFVGSSLHVDGTQLAQELNNTAYVYLQFEDLTEAERLLTEALQLDKFNAGLLDSIGWLKFKQDKFVEARMYVQRALEDEDKLREEFGIEGLQEVRYHLVCILDKLGEGRAADSLVNLMRASGGSGRKWLTKAVSVRSSNPGGPLH